MGLKAGIATSLAGAAGQNCLALVLIAIGYVLVFFELWITGARTFSHDGIRFMAVYALFVDSLRQGIFPLWNPYVNCGEPFFFLISNAMLIDPVALVTIGIQIAAGADWLTIGHTTALVKYLVFIAGAFAFFKQASNCRAAAVLGTLTLAFSSAGVIYFRQIAFLDFFYLLPAMAFLMLRLAGSGQARDLFLLTLLTGITVSSFRGIYLAIVIAVWAGALALTTGGAPGFFRDNKAVLLVCAAALVLCCLPGLAVLSHNTEVFAYLRKHQAVAATNSQPADFLLLVAPYFAERYFSPVRVLRLNESIAYIGLLPMMLAIYGIVWAHNRFKKPLVISLVLTTAIMLGKYGLVAPLIDQIVPVFRMLRHTNMFIFAFMLAMTCFACIGFADLWTAADDAQRAVKLKRLKAVGLGIVAALILVTIAFAVLHHLTWQRLLATLPKSLAFFKGDVGNFTQSRNMNLVGGGVFVGGATVLWCNRRWLGTSKRKTVFFLFCLFIVFDLQLFSRFLFGFTTWPRTADPPHTAAVDTLPANRIEVLPPDFRFSAYPQLISKVHTATMPMNLWGTHFFEMRHYYELRTGRAAETLRPSSRFNAATTRLPNDLTRLVAFARLVHNRFDDTQERLVLTNLEHLEHYVIAALNAVIQDPELGRKFWAYRQQEAPDILSDMDAGPSLPAAASPGSTGTADHPVPPGPVSAKQIRRLLMEMFHVKSGYDHLSEAVRDPDGRHPVALVALFPELLAAKDEQALAAGLDAIVNDDEKRKRFAGAYHAAFWKEHFGSRYGLDEAGAWEDRQRVRTMMAHFFPVKAEPTPLFLSFCGVTRPILRMVDFNDVVRVENLEKALVDSGAHLREDLVFVEEDFGGKNRADGAAAASDGNGGGPPGDVEVLGYGPNRIEILARNQRGGLLYFADGHARDWKVTVNGQSQKVLRANLAFKAVALDRGVHRVVFHYDPLWFKLAVAGYGLGMALALGGWMVCRINGVRGAGGAENSASGGSARGRGRPP